MENLINNIYFKIGLVLILIDSLFIFFIYKKFNDQITTVQGSPIKFNFIGAILCYICLIFMLNYFIIKEGRNIFDAFILGLCTYGVYEFTNLGTLNNWNINMAFIDTLWGGILFALTTHIVKSTLVTPAKSIAISD